MISPLKANSGPDNWRLPYTIKVVTYPGDIETTRIVWCEEEPSTPPTVTTTIPPAAPVTCAAPRGNVVPFRISSPGADVDAWLRGALALGPRDAAALKAEAKGCGISTGALYRAVKRLGVIIDGGGFGEAKTWRL